MARSGGTVHRMDTSGTEPESQPVDENRVAKVPGALELLWTDRKLLGCYRSETCRILFKWWNRRSQRRSYTWRSFNRRLQRFAVPLPRIVEGVKRTIGLSNTPAMTNQQMREVSLLGEHYVPCRAGANGSEEPGAGKPPAGICAGGAGQPASLPRSLHSQWPGLRGRLRPRPRPRTLPPFAGQNGLV